jgi:flagellar L-ring protein FlgH
MRPAPPADYRAAYPPVAQPPVATNGAIYQSGYGMALFEDIKARRIGDTITIVLQERTQASKDAKTETSKENDISIANPTILGRLPVQCAGHPAAGQQPRQQPRGGAFLQSGIQG